MHCTKKIAAVVLPFLFAPAALAVTPESFTKDLELFDQELEEVRMQQNMWMQDRAFERYDGFFPQQNNDDAASDSTSSALPTQSFSDVPTDVWFARYVDDMGSLGIMEGYKDKDGVPIGTFGPADSVTVEQIAKMAVIASHVDQSKCPSSPKNEAAQTSWSSGFIACAEQLGWQVFVDGSVDPMRPALRSEVVTTVLEAFSRQLEPATGELFSDVSSTMPARHAIETAARDGIVSGYTNENGSPTGYFGPFDSVNRAETAKIFSLAMLTYAAR